MSDVPASPVLPETAVSGAATHYSAPTEIPRGHDVGYIVEFTGAPNGQPFVEVANPTDIEKQFGYHRWVRYTRVEIPAIANGVTADAAAAARFGIELVNLPFSAVRFGYAHASANGTVAATISVKRKG